MIKTTSKHPKHLSALFVLLAVGLATGARAQIGSGWTRFYPSSFLDVQSSGTHKHYPLSNYLRVDGVEYSYNPDTGIQTFKLLSTASNRIERRNDEHYTSGKRQMQGDLKISNISDQSVHQIFYGSSGPVIMTKGFGANGGEIRKYGGGTVLASGINGVWVRYNQITVVGNRMEIYINGSRKWSGGCPSGSGFNNKYGLYGTKVTPSPVVQWKWVKHFQ